MKVSAAIHRLRQMPPDARLLVRDKDNRWLFVTDARFSYVNADGTQPPSHLLIDGVSYVRSDLGILDGLKLPTLAERSQERYATPKAQITPNVVTREEKRKAKKADAESFRAAVWARDKGQCRATGVLLVKSGTTDPHKLGEVDHSIPRSLAPERIYDVSNGLLLSKYLNRLRKAVCPEAPEFKLFDYSGPEDRSQPQTFIWRDRTGQITKQRIG